MTKLETKFMGIDIKNPIVVGASNLSQNAETLVKMEKAGAAAIVYKSLFEEQIQYEKIQMEEDLHEYDERHAEMISTHPGLKHAGPKEYLLNLKEAKKALSVPLIASLNAVEKETWVEYAQLIEETGVDGLELNLYSIPGYTESEAAEPENQQIEILKAVKKVVNFPISVKLGPFYTNTLSVISKMDKVGVNGYVLFNRLFQPDIDTDKEKHHIPFNLSKEGDYKLSLRYAGMLYNNVQGNICSNTGIYTGKDIAKLLLAGSDSVQVVSAIYKHKPEHIATMLEELESWMKSHSYNSLKDFQGKLSQTSTKDKFAYTRAQYIDILMNAEEIIKKHPTG